MHHLVLELDMLPGPVIPGYSSGLTAQVAGTVEVTEAGFSIDSAALTLLDSGSWQPGTVAVPGLGTFPTSADFGRLFQWLPCRGSEHVVSRFQRSGPVPRG